MNIYQRIGRPIVLVAVSLILPVGVSFAASVSVQLEGGDAECCVSAGGSNEISRTLVNSVSGELAAYAFANATTGVMRAETYTTNWVDPDSSSLRLAPASARATLNVTLNNFNTEIYTLKNGDLGLSFDANYFRDQQNSHAGQNQFQLRLDAFVYDAAGVRQSINRAWVNHIVQFDETSIWDNVPDTTNPGLIEETGAGVVNVTTSYDSIFGTLSMSSLNVESGGYVQLSMLLYVNSDATAKSDAPPDLALYPSAGTDAANTVRMYYADTSGAGLTIETDSPAEWENAPSVVPLPAAAWLFLSAMGCLGWLRRRATA